MEVQTITIPVKTDMDPSALLEIAYEILRRIEDMIEAYGEEGKIDEDEVSVG